MQTNDSSENYGPDTGVCSQFSSGEARNDSDFTGKQMFCNDEEFCTTEKAYKNANGSPQTKAQWIVSRLCSVFMIQTISVYTHT